MGGALIQHRNYGLPLAGSTGANQNGLADVAFVEPGFDRGDTFVAWTQSLALGAKLNRRNTAYFEWFGIFSHGREDEVSLSYLNIGVDHLLTKNVVLDVRVGWALTPDADDVFAGIGGGFRF